MQLAYIAPPSATELIRNNNANSSIVNLQRKVLSFQNKSEIQQQRNITATSISNKLRNFIENIVQRS